MCPGSLLGQNWLNISSPGSQQSDWVHYCSTRRKVNSEKMCIARIILKRWSVCISISKNTIIEEYLIVCYMPHQTFIIYNVNLKHRRPGKGPVP